MDLHVALGRGAQGSSGAVSVAPPVDPTVARGALRNGLTAECAGPAGHPVTPGSRPGAMRGDQSPPDLLAEFGPLQGFLDDPEIEEIWINSPGRVFVARGGRSSLTSTVMTADMVRHLVERMLIASGRRIDVSAPFVDAPLRDGSRLHVAIPDITREHWVVNIRKFVVRARDVDDLVALGMLSQAASDYLRDAILTGRNVLVAGGTQAGKTTLLGALLGCVPPSERLITCEETFELSVPEHPDWVAMQTRPAGLEGTGEITLRRLVREALRMRPTRLVVGEVRQQEALELLIAMNSGLPAMATLHANGAREAITKLCTLPLLAGPNISADFVRPTVATCVDVVVHLAIARDGSRHVNEIMEVPGTVEGAVIALAPAAGPDGRPIVVPQSRRGSRAGGQPWVP